MSQALVDLFPSIGLDSSRFVKCTLASFNIFIGTFLILFFVVRKWRDSSNRRKAFEGFAVFYNFDPLVPDNWYHQSSEALFSFKVFSCLISFSFALLYPFRFLFLFYFIQL